MSRLHRDIKVLTDQLLYLLEICFEALGRIGDLASFEAMFDFVCVFSMKACS